MPVVAGRVLDAAGAPVAAARVMFGAAPVAVPDIATLTGADGRFALAAPAAGRYEVVCATEEGSAAVVVDVAGEEPAEVELVVPG